MFAARPPSQGRRRAGATLITALLVPALLASAPVGAAPPRSAAPATAAAPAAVRATAPAALPGAVASGVRQPKVQQVPLSGINKRVLARAPRPDAHEGGEVGALSVHPELQPAVAAKVKPRKPAELVAVMADQAFPDGSVIQVRVKEKRRWSAWTELHLDPAHGPDPGSPEAAGARIGSAPLLARNARKVQVRIDTPDGRVPRGTQLSLVNAPKAASDASLGRGQVSAMGTVGMPSIITRAQWGANESWRGREPWYSDTVRGGFIHHTASTSSYSASQAASQIRAIYAYHTKSLGHSDIDYNFVVDRFGRLYEGRYGGMDRPVIGGHTAGFNDRTFAVVALGNFQTYSPSSSAMAAMKDAIARLFAWRLGLVGINPASTVELVSAGFIRATRYPKGSVATISATSSHQTVNYTACPGTYLQKQLGSIRALGASYSDVVVSSPTPIDPFTMGDRAAVGISSYATQAVSWTADILSPCSDTPVRSFSGRTGGAGAIKVTWDLRDAAGAPVLPATYTIRMSGTRADGSPVPVVSSTVTIRPAPGGAWGPCANVSRVTGSSDAATSVIWGRISAPAATVVVLTAPATASGAARAAGVAGAPLARSLGAPLLVTPGDSLAGEVAADIRERGATEVIIVGGPAVVSDSVGAAVAALGVPVTRIDGPDDATMAANVAARMPPGGQAVLVSPDGARAHSLLGSALAASRGIPALVAPASGVPEVTAAALAGRTQVFVSAPAVALSDEEVAAGLRGGAWTRLTGADEVAASAAVGAAYPAASSNVVVLPDTATTWATAPAAAATGAPLLFTSGEVLPQSLADVIGSRAALRSVTTPAASSTLGDPVLGQVSRLLRGEPWSPPGTRVPVVSDPPEPVPTPTGARKVYRTNASPEPVGKGSQVKVKARIRVKYTDGKWRKAPAGLPYKLKFKRKGKGKKYKTVLKGTTQSGRALAYVKAKRSGRWRLIVDGKKTKSDYVRVRR